MKNKVYKLEQLKNLQNENVKKDSEIIKMKGKSETYALSETYADDDVHHEGIFNHADDYVRHEDLIEKLNIFTQRHSENCGN